MDSGPTFPYSRQQLRSGVDESLFIGGTTFGFGNAPIGTDLLSSTLIGGRFIGSQPTPEQTTAAPYDSLPAGSIPLYIQQQGGLTQYTLDFVVVAIPEPSAPMLLLVSGLVIGRTTFRKTRYISLGNWVVWYRRIPGTFFNVLLVRIADRSSLS